MKVIQINAVCDIGSTGRICRELNDFLIQSGHHGLIIYGNGTSDYEFAYKVSSKIGVKAHALLARFLGKNAAYSPFATRKLVNTLRFFEPDIVHLHNLHGNYINLNPLLCYLRKKDIPTVLTLHDCWFFTGKCVYYTRMECNKWQTGCYSCPKLRGDIPSWFLDRTTEMWREKKELFAAIPRLAVIGVSDWITGEARKSFLKDAAIIQRIYNWIDLDVFYPRGDAGCSQFGISEEKYTVLCIGAGWSEDSYKTKDLLKLANLLPEDYEIILAGDVPFAQNLPKNIKSVGYISSTEDLAKLYSACDVYVHLSREDTFGKVIAEALACGTPAVVYDSTACPEILGDGCGAVVAQGDVMAIYHAMEEIRKHPKKVYVARCTEHVAANFPKDKLIKDTLNLYQRVMEK